MAKAKPKPGAAAREALRLMITPKDEEETPEESPAGPSEGKGGIVIRIGPATEDDEAFEQELMKMKKR